MKYIILLFLILCRFSLAETKLKVMVIDTGVDGSNLSLVKHIPKQYQTSFDMNDTDGHGSHTFGIIAEDACSQVELIPCKAFLKGIYTPRDRVFDCFQRALDLNVDVINFSGGGYGYNPDELDYLEKLNKKDIILVAALGNNKLDTTYNPYYPASYDLPNIVSVGALDPNKNAACFSNYNDRSVWEPGVNIYSDYLDNTKKSLSGTSMATAKHTARLVKFFCKKINK